MSTKVELLRPKEKIYLIVRSLGLPFCFEISTRDIGFSWWN